MTCMVCKHEWCWSCGIAYRSKLHKMIGPMCGVIHEINFGKRKLNILIRILLELLLFILWPVIALVLGLIIYCIKIHSTMKIFNWTDCYLSRCCRQSRRSANHRRRQYINNSKSKLMVQTISFVDENKKKSCCVCNNQKGINCLRIFWKIL